MNLCALMRWLFYFGIVLIGLTCVSKRGEEVKLILAKPNSATKQVSSIRKPSSSMNIIVRKRGAVMMEWTSQYLSSSYSLPEESFKVSPLPLGMNWRKCWTTGLINHCPNSATRDHYCVQSLSFPCQPEELLLVTCFRRLEKSTLAGFKTAHLPFTN